MVHSSFNSLFPSAGPHFQPFFNLIVEEHCLYPRPGGWPDITNRKGELHTSCIMCTLHILMFVKGSIYAGRR